MSPSASRPRRRGLAAERDNLALSLALIRTGEARTRHEIQRVTRLGRAAVAERVATLIDLGLVREEGLAASTGGRAPRSLGFNATAGYVLAASLGTTTLGVGLTDLTGSLLIEHHEPADIGLGAPKIIGRITELFGWMLSRYSAAGHAWAISLALPSIVGPIVDRHGSVAASGIMPGWAEFPLDMHLGAHFDAAVYVGNEVQVMALGELRHGQGQGLTDLVFVKVGTGISAGICADGRIHRGASGLAGDIGHIVVDVGSDVICRCGNTGCLEALAGGTAIARDGRRAAASGRSSLLSETLEMNGSLTAADVGAAASRGDPASVELISRSGRLVGETLATLVAAYNPSRVVVGGGVAQSGAIFMAAIRDGIHRRSRSSTIESMSVTASELGKTAGLTGGASAALDAVFERDRVAEWIALGAPRTTRSPGKTDAGAAQPKEPRRVHKAPMQRSSTTAAIPSRIV